MVYRVGEKVLQKTQEVFRGKVNDVIVCRDISDGGNIYYTVIIVHDRKIAKQLMELFHTEEQNGTKFIIDFTWKDSYFMVFEYVAERLLERFFTSEIFTVNECEQMGLRLAMECLAAKIPYPVLYLQLKQRQIHISSDKSIYLGYNLDLENFSGDVTERDCAVLCARIVFEYLENVKNGKSISYKLLEKKLWKGSYGNITEFYKDLKMASEPVEKERVSTKIKERLKKSQDKFFRYFTIVCIALGIVVVTMVVSQMIFSDIPLMKLFINSFEQIGTESLLQ